MYVVKVNGVAVADKTVTGLAEKAVKAAAAGINETDGLSFVRDSSEVTEAKAIESFQWARIAAPYVNYDFLMWLEQARVI